MRHIGILLVALVITVAGLSAGIVMATPAKNFSAKVLGEATLDPFDIETKDFKVHSKKSADVVVQEVTFREGGHSGWHSHPGTPIVLVKEGQIALTQADGCTTEVFGPGEGFAETPGHVLIARNVGGPGEKAVTIVTFLANPTGEPTRTDEDAPEDCDVPLD
jgi:quercetin dioxygenase-like cupin family protein